MTGDNVAALVVAPTARPPVGLIGQQASEIEPRRTRFLDDAQMLPKASVVVVFGRAGLGKTLYAGTLAALATTGRLDGGAFDVLYSTGEDDPASVLVPRLRAAGADLDRVHFTAYHGGDGIGQALELPDHAPQLHELARNLGAGLVVIDPIAAHLGKDINAHRDSDVRRALAPLAKMAADLDLTVLVVAHPRKSADPEVLNRLGMSGAFGNAPRSVLVFGVDPDDEEGPGGSRRVLAQAKTNVSAYAESVACHIEVRDLAPDGEPWPVPVLVLDGASPHGAADVMDGVEPEERTERDEARDWLENEAGLPRRSREIFADGKARSLSRRTLERAKRDAGIKADQAADGWYWLAPGQVAL